MTHWHVTVWYSPCFVFFYSSGVQFNLQYCGTFHHVSDRKKCQHKVYSAAALELSVTTRGLLQQAEWLQSLFDSEVNLKLLRKDRRSITQPVREIRLHIGLTTGPSADKDHVWQPKALEQLLFLRSRRGSSHNINSISTYCSPGHVIFKLTTLNTTSRVWHLLFLLLFKITILYRRQVVWKAAENVLNIQELS